MPDFIVELFTSSQGDAGVNAFLLERHEIENYLIEPDLIVEAVKKCGGSISAKEVSKIIVSVAQELKAEARQASKNCAELVNRHLGSNKVDDLEINVYKWFDELDLSKLETIQKVFPGKELLPKVIDSLNSTLGVKITRGKIVSAIKESLVAEDIVTYLKGN